MLIHKNHLKKQKYGTESVEETFKISKFRWNILLWHDQTQEHEFGCLYAMLVNKIRKHSKFLNFDKIFYCGMTRLRNSILNYYSLCRYVKAVKPKKVIRIFENHLKFQNFNTQFLLQHSQTRAQIKNVFAQKLL